MPNAIWMAGYQVCREYVEGNVKSFLVECMTTLDACPKCGVIGRMYKHGTSDVTYQDAPSYGHQVVLHIKAQRYICRECRATSVQPLPGMDTKRQMTKRCADYIAREGVEMTFSALARQVGVHEKTVRMVCHEAFAAKMADWKVEAPWMHRQTPSTRHRGSSPARALCRRAQSSRHAGGPGSSCEPGRIA